MIRRDFVIYLSLLLMSIGGAYYVSLPAKKGGESRKEWLKIDPKSVTKLGFDSKDEKVVVEKKENLKGGYWVEVSPKQVAEADPTKKEKPVESKSVGFRANDNLDDVLESLNPLYVERVIGEIETQKEGEFGVDDENSAGVFYVETSGGRQLEFKMGKRAYGSSKNFVRDLKSSKILLVQGREIQKIVKAKSRIFEKRLFDQDLDEIKNVEIKDEKNRTKVIEHTKRDGSGELQWHDPGEDGAVKASYKSWMSKLSRLRVSSMMSSKPEDAKLLVSINLDKGSDKGTGLQVWQDGSRKYALQSDFLGGFARVEEKKIDGLVKDLSTIFSD